MTASTVVQLPYASYLVSFSRALCLGVTEEKECIESDLICFQGVEIRLRVCPKDKRAISSTYLSFEMIAKCSEGVTADLKLGYKFAPSLNSIPAFEFSCDEVNFSSITETSVGKQYLMKTESLPLNRTCFIENSLQFIVDIRPHGNLSMVKPFPWFSNIPGMLFDQPTSDFTMQIFNCAAVVPCHKLILSLVSQVFKAMFENQMQESVSNEIVISDFSEEVVRSFLKCIYDQSAVKTELETHAEQLLLFANKYEVVDLVNLATEYINKSLSQENVIGTLQYAHNYDFKVIKLAALDYMSANASFFMKQSSLSDILGSALMAEYTFHFAEHFISEPPRKKVARQSYTV